MKKFLGIFVAAALVAGFAGQSTATGLADYDLYRVVYNTAGTQEVITDLGHLKTTGSTGNDNIYYLSAPAASNGKIVGATNYTVGNGANGLTTTMFGFTGGATNTYVDWTHQEWVDPNNHSLGTYTVNDAANLRVAYFAKAGSGQTALSAWATDTVSTGNPTAQANGGTALINAFTSMSSVYNLSAPGTLQGSKTNTNGYYYQMDGNGTKIAALAGLFNGTTNKSEVTLAEIGTGGYVSQKFDFFTGDFSTQKTGKLSATILTELGADGKIYTEIVPSVVPVPPSVWMLGPALLGLVGVRRRIWS